MKSKYKILFNILLYFFICSSITPNFVKASSRTYKKVLILNSYTEDFNWTHSINEGIKRTFKKNNFRVDYYVHYMNVKTSMSEEYKKQLYNLYLSQYKQELIDLVIVTDDIAYQFLLSYHNELFKNTPIVFYRMNQVNQSQLINEPLITGVSQGIDIRSNINTMLKLQPKMQQVYVVYENSPPLLDIKNKIVRYIQRVYPHLKVTALTLQQLKFISKTDQLKKQAMILMPIRYNQYRQAIFPEEIVSQIREVYQGPIYSYWDMYNKNGVLGGKMEIGNEVGALIAKKGIEIISGKSPEQIDIEEMPVRFIFDYNELKRLDMDVKDLPNNRTIINAPSEFMPINKDIIWVCLSLAVIILIVIIKVLLTNIRRRVKMEKKLIHSKERYQKLVSLLPDMLLVVTEGKVRFVNIKGVQLLGASAKEEILGRDITEFIDFSEGRGMQPNSEIDFKVNGYVIPEELKLRTLDGNILDIEIIYNSITYDNSSAALCVIRDITERKLLNEVVEYEKLRNDFFANLSHELRTPISLMLSTIQLMELFIKEEQEIQVLDKIKKYLRTLHQNGYRLLRLVNNLIDLTKIDTGFMKLNGGMYNIVQIVEDITMSMVDFAHSKEISVEFDTEVEELYMIVDPDKIERILLNLFSNAIKFTEPCGKIFVKLQMREEKIWIFVRDTGVGIPKDKLKYIFERFVQVDKSMRRNNEGSGIGLALVKSFVELHAGTISVRSKCGKGTEFCIGLPIQTLNQIEQNYNNTVSECRNYAEMANIEFSDIYNTI